MHITDIHARLEILTHAAQERRLMSDAGFATLLGGADLDFMTAEERAERHTLVMMLPTQLEEVQAARARIQARVAQRKTLRARVAG